LVTVRFETRLTGVGTVRTFAVDDAALSPAAPLPPSPIYGDDMDNRTREIPTPDGAMPLYEATPDGEPGGAVVVIQEAFGVTAHIEDVCRRFAEVGFTAVAPHLYHRTGSPVLGPDMELTKPHMGSITREGLLVDLGATLDHLAALGFGPERVGVVGFCMGGSITVLAASEFALGAAVTFYGGGVSTGRLGMPPLLELAPHLQTPWLGIFGDLDASIPVDDVEALRVAAAGTQVPTEVIRYPGAGHAFHNDTRADRYHEESARDAWSRTLAWFDRLS
jgi:carboxymethylenebutenolidase